jgi:hypothetical protein
MAVAAHFVGARAGLHVAERCSVSSVEREAVEFPAVLARIEAVEFPTVPARIEGPLACVTLVSVSDGIPGRTSGSEVVPSYLLDLVRWAAAELEV